MARKKFKKGRAALNRYAEKRMFALPGLALMVKAKKKGWFR